MSCLHIGDNPMADVQAPLKYGMDSYGIKSAFEMMKISNFVNIMPWVNHCNEKNLLGLVLAEVFNNPFALYDTAGVVRVDSFEKIVKIFAASLAAIYILELISYLEKETDYQKVIFGARDGYIFMKIYDKFREKYGKNRELPEPVYLLVSRKLCIRAGMKTGNDVGILKIYGNSDRPETTLTGILGIPEERTVPYDQESYADVLDYYNVHQEEILDRSRIVRQRYKKYLEHCGLDLNQKYLFCDFISQGTIQHLLNQIFYKPIDGFFLSRYIGQKPFPIHAESIYVDQCHGGTILFEKHCFLETIFSSPEPSVEDMDENDKPIFSNEIRTEEEIKNMCREQEGIEKFFGIIMKIYGWMEKR